MSTCTRIDSSALSVLLDLRNPACYLALHPAAALADEFGTEINWLPLTVPPLRPPSAGARGDDRGTIHRRHRARAIAREIETYGRTQGLLLRDLYRDPDAGPFNLGWLWVRESTPRDLFAFLSEGFRAYWSLELDPSSLGSVAQLVAAVGGDARRFHAWCRDEGPAIAEAVAGDLNERQLFAVPGYLVDGEFFVGRQHLPMIRWILGGRSGPGPI